MSTVSERLSAALADRYRIEREIGEGGMATVFLAIDARHERRVAIKVLHPELSAMLGPDRFLSEIKLTASLQHPNILPLFDSGVADGLLYYVMPFVEGETLRGRLERERQLPIADSVRLATEIADALQYAHERGIVHRDIKPENVLLQSGRAVVADFGIALAVQSAGGSRMTQTGMSLGTPQYMAPEQAMGERNVDARADLYALGAVTYEMLAGEPPFTGPTAQAIVAKVMTERSRPLRAVRDTVPESVERAVSVALEKLPADRFATANEFAAALTSMTTSAATRGIGTTTNPAGSRQQRAPWSAVGIGAVALVALAAGLAIGATVMTSRAKSSANDAALQIRFAVAPPDSVGLRLICCGQLFAISPNGRWLVYQGSPSVNDGKSNAAHDHVLYLRDLTDLSVRRLPSSTNATAIFFSPASDEVGFFVDRQMRRLSLSGTEAQAITTIPDGFIGGASWASDGRIVFGVSGRMLTVQANGGTPTALFPADTNGLQFTGPQFVTEHNVLLYSLSSFAKLPLVHWRSLASGKTHVVAAGTTPRYLAAAKALLLVRSDGSLIRYPFDIATGDTTGPGERLAGGIVTRSPILAHAEYSVSATGTLVTATRREVFGASGLSLVEIRDTPKSVPIMPDFIGYAEPTFSPSGDRIAVNVMRAQNGYVWYMYDVARQASTRIRADSGSGNGKLAWNSTGDSLLMLSAANTLTIVPADGSAAPRQLFTLGNWSISSERLSAWGPWLVMTGVRPGGTQVPDIVVVHRDSLGLMRPYISTPFAEAEPAIAPNGQYLAYASSENGRDDIFVSAFPTAGARVLVSPEGGFRARWSRDSRTIYFARGNDLYAVPFTPGPAGAPPTIGRPTLLYGRDPWGQVDIAPDGKSAVFVDRAREGVPTSLIVRLNAVH